MLSKEIKELNQYLRLSSYRDGEYILHEEYQELMDIISRNPIARELENIRYQYLVGKMTKEEYDQACMGRVNQLTLKQKNHSNEGDVL